MKPLEAFNIENRGRERRGKLKGKVKINFGLFFFRSIALLTHFSRLPFSRGNEEKCAIQIYL
jgi:hypothetical protein